MKIIPPGMVTLPVDGYEIACLNRINFNAYFMFFPADYHSPPLV